MSFLRRKKSKPVKKKKADQLPDALSTTNSSGISKKLEIDGNQFYILVKKLEESDEETQEDDGEMEKDGQEITIYSDVKAPIVRIREYLKRGVDPVKVELMLVKIMDETLEVESVPWSKIAVELIG